LDDITIPKQTKCWGIVFIRRQRRRKKFFSWPCERVRVSRCVL